MATCGINCASPVTLTRKSALSSPLLQQFTVRATSQFFASSSSSSSSRFDQPTSFPQVTNKTANTFAFPPGPVTHSHLFRYIHCSAVLFMFIIFILLSTFYLYTNSHTHTYPGTYRGRKSLFLLCFVRQFVFISSFNLTHTYTQTLTESYVRNLVSDCR